MSDLDEILNDNESTGEDVQEEAQATEEPAVEEPQKEATEEAKAETEVTEEPEKEPDKEAEQAKDSTPESENDEKSNWQFEAYKDEKRKRQGLESENDELKRKLKDLENPKEPEKVPDAVDDPEGYTNYIQNQVNQQTMNMKANMSEFMAVREFGQDVVTEKLDTFKTMLGEDPSLHARVANAVSPYHEMIDIVDKAERLKQLDNVEDMEAKIRAEVEEKVRAEYESKLTGQNAKRESVTPSLNTKASSATEKPDDSLEAILSGR